MKTRAGLVLGTILLCASAALLAGAEKAQPVSPFHGLWKWKFTMPDGSEVSPRLRIKEEEGQISGTTRFRPGADTPLTNLVIEGTRIRFEVVRARDGQAAVTRYAGKLDGDIIRGKITSNWTGEEQTYDWEAKRLNSAEGTWRWSVTFGEFEIQSTATLKEEGEKVTGRIASRRGSDQEIKSGKLKDGKISFETERERDGEKYVTKYSGKLSGDQIIGTIRSNFGGRPRTNDWDAVRID